MEDYMSLKIVCSTLNEIVSALNAITPRLPLDIRKRLVNVYLFYSRNFGIAGVFERLNDRSVAAILSEFEPENDQSPIEEGELNGVRFKLFAPPTGHTSVSDTPDNTAN
jgi:hypothetical protein